MPKLVVALLVLLLLPMPGCTSDPTDAKTDTSAQPSEDNSGRVVVLCSRDEGTLGPLWDLVRQKLPEIKLVLEYGNDVDYLERILLDRNAPRSDLFLAETSATMDKAGAEGVLGSIPEELLQLVPARYRGSQGNWVGLSTRARVLVRRKGLKRPPGSLEDLADPRWKGRVARTVATNPSFVDGVASYLADRGEVRAKRWVAGIQANSAGNIHPQQIQTIAAVAENQADVALVNHDSFYRHVLGQEVEADASTEELRAKMKAATIEIVFPSGPGKRVAWNTGGAGIVAGAPNVEGAAAVLEVLLSPAGQEAYAFPNREYPVVEGVPSPPAVQPADSFDWSSTPLTDLALKQGTALALIQDLGLK